MKTPVEIPVRVTPTMRAALARLVRGQSLPGHVHANTYQALKDKGLVEDPYTITEAGRAAVTTPRGRSE